MPAKIVKRDLKPKIPIGRWIVLGVVGLGLFMGYGHLQEPNKAAVNKAGNRQDPNLAPPQVAPKSHFVSMAGGQPDTALGRVLRDYLKMYHPDQSAILLVDGATNRIMAWGETHNRVYDASKAQNLVDPTKPIASLTKMITAAAAFEIKKLQAGSQVPMKGAFHTLYKPQLIDEGGPTVPIKNAFALSANPAFGILGYRVGGAGLRTVAAKLGFNQKLPGLSAPGVLNIPDTGYRLAEVASGFFEGNQTAPLHISAIVRSLLYRTPIQLPFNEALAVETGLPHVRQPWIGERLSNSTYEQLLPTFEATNELGTAAKSHHKYLKKIYQDRLLIGSKTGSLGNGSPESPRYEWYVGFAVDRKDPSNALIFTLLQIHEKIRSLPATALGTLLINQWADRHIQP